MAAAPAAEQAEGAAKLRVERQPSRESLSTRSDASSPGGALPRSMRRASLTHHGYDVAAVVAPAPEGHRQEQFAAAAPSVTISDDVPGGNFSAGLRQQDGAQDPAVAARQRWGVVQKEVLGQVAGGQMRAAAFMVNELRAELLEVSSQKQALAAELSELKERHEALSAAPNISIEEVLTSLGTALAQVNSAKDQSLSFVYEASTWAATQDQQSMQELERCKADEAALRAELSEAQKQNATFAAKLDEQAQAIIRLRTELDEQRSPTGPATPSRPESFYLGDSVDPDNPDENWPPTPRAGVLAAPSDETIGDSDWQSLDMVAELYADKDVGRIGVGFRNLPPSVLIVRRVTVGSWAHLQGIQIGDEIMSVNRRRARDFRAAEFLDTMTQRPLLIRIRRTLAKDNVEPVSVMMRLKIQGMGDAPRTESENQTSSSDSEDESSDDEDGNPAVVRMLSDKSCQEQDMHELAKQVRKEALKSAKEKLKDKARQKAMLMAFASVPSKLSEEEEHVHQEEESKLKTLLKEKMQRIIAMESSTKTRKHEDTGKSEAGAAREAPPEKTEAWAENLPKATLESTDPETTPGQPSASSQSEAAKEEEYF
eukprot:TRINITY_DN2385_c0_g2_i1.p1 TRINITY_DN2385_c0_g2~~TRINITY_DN2385_c0_g2_i1.p1  ORF type:complete len:598 (-),score=160.91 TRINITY_DN2385_c0_g2_i1:31-1824(-)